MTPTEVTALIEAAPLPRAYRLEVTVQRKHLLRSLWNVRVFRGDERVHGRSYYNVAAGILIAQRWAWNDAGVTA